ncbi:hypothetical protein FE257_005815 [Aspergillus nanangensis]|uniref:Uncharacterized protein n=1 Tax=Aspergillus nanangensis TaxID=2582783 RepID=A0AAD4GMQ0_ASPNN|nr:hypothetical protein FE257_005815 [Aspergillus nanangensis]
MDPSRIIPINFRSVEFADYGSLDNISFCYQPPPPKPITTSRWKPYQVSSTLAHIPHRTCLLPPKPGVSVATIPHSGAPETAQSPRNSSSAAASEPAHIQIDDGDSRKIVNQELVAMKDISQERSDEQAPLSIQPATSDSRPFATESTSLDLPEESIEVSRSPRQSGVRSTPSICDNLSTGVSRSPSVGVRDDTLGPEGEPQTKNINVEDRTIGDSQSEGTARYGAEDAGSKTCCMESLRYASVGAEGRSAGTHECDNRGHANDDRGAAASSPVQSRPSAEQSCRACCHPQENVGGLRQFRPVSANPPVRQPDRQTTMTTESPPSRTPNVGESSTDDCESVNGQAANGLMKDYSTLTSGPTGEPNARVAKRKRHLPGVETSAGCTSALSDDDMRGLSGLSHRPPEDSFPSTAGEPQEVFGRGILRIQPHGPRNAYVITFLPDVVQPASMLPVSEMCEESSHSTSRQMANPENAPVTGSVPGAQSDLPIDPLILADGPWETGDPHLPSPLGDDPKPSDTICPYPDPPPSFSSPLGPRDSVELGQHKEAQFTSSPDVRHSSAAGNPPSSNTTGPTHCGGQSKSRKRKPRRGDGQPSKRVRGSHTSAAEGDALAALHTYFLSLPPDKRLQLLPRLLEDALPHHMPTLDLLTTGNRNARPASTPTPWSDESEPDFSSRKGMPYSPQGRRLLLTLKRERRPWSEVEEIFSKQFPGRSKGSLQVFFCTTLKKQEQ